MDVNIYSDSDAFIDCLITDTHRRRCLIVLLVPILFALIKSRLMYLEIQNTSLCLPLFG